MGYPITGSLDPVLTQPNQYQCNILMSYKTFGLCVFSEKKLKPSFLAHKFNKTIENVATLCNFLTKITGDRKGPSCKKRNLGKSTINRGKGVISFSHNWIRLGIDRNWLFCLCGLWITPVMGHPILHGYYLIKPKGLGIGNLPFIWWAESAWTRNTEQLFLIL